VGRLSHHDPIRAVGYLIALLDDPERRTVTAAAAALADTGDRRAVEALRALRETHPTQRVRREAQRLLKKLEG
jgi:HEAT repeat protein